MHEGSQGGTEGTLRYVLVNAKVCFALQSTEHTEGSEVSFKDCDHHGRGQSPVKI